MAEPVGVLARIAASKREEFARRYDGVSSMRAAGPRAGDQPQPAAVLARNGARFILEIKKASPSAGAIRPGADPATLALGFAGLPTR